MHLAVLALLLQQHPANPANFPIAKVEITPSAAEVEVGGKVQLAARAIDAGGQPVSTAAIEWFVASDAGKVDSTGLVTGGYSGFVRVAAVAAIPGQQGQKIEFALVHVLPESPARVDVAPAPTKLGAGTRLTLLGTAFSKHGDRRADLVSFASSNPRVASATAEGRLPALAPGRATITAKAGPAAPPVAVQVVANTVARVVIDPAASALRTGDVVRFAVTARDQAGRSPPGRSQIGRAHV